MNPAYKKLRLKNNTLDLSKGIIHTQNGQTVNQKEESKENEKINEN